MKRFARSASDKHVASQIEAPNRTRESGRFRRKARTWLPAAVLTSCLLLPWLIFAVLDHVWPLQLTGNRSAGKAETASDGSRLFATTVVDSSGNPLRSFADPNGVWRYPVRLEDVSPLYIEALLGYEDRWFYNHPGVNPLAMLRACMQNLTSGRVVSGGSTLTMQVAGLLDPYPRTLTGKLRQLFRALQLEHHLNKAEILTLYLNLAPFGGPLEGVQAACFSYLGKSARYLSHAEAALLAVLPQSPSRLRPDRYPERAEKARDKVLARLRQYAVWPVQALDEAEQEPVISLQPEREQQAPLLARRLYAAHLNQDTMFERPEELRGQLDSLLQPIRTTIDGRLQRNLARLLDRYSQRLPSGCSAATLVVRNADMAVLGYLGTARFGDPQRFGHIDMVRAIRSPGSTLKPFLYGMALESGLIHSRSLLSDVPLYGSAYSPANFGGGYSGPVAADTALQRSLNVPAIQLIDAVGAKRFTDRLRGAGLNLFLPGKSAPNPAIILGGVGVRMEELAGIYSALGREGIAGELRFTEDAPLREHYLLSASASWIVRRILCRDEEPGKSSLTDSTANASCRLAWKTGTSYGYRDAWAIGVTPHYTIAVWVGRPDGSPNPGHYGLVSGMPLLQKTALLLQDSGSFSPPPPDVARQEICWPLGTAASRPENSTPAENNCHQRLTAWTIDGLTPPTLALQSQAFSTSQQADGPNRAIIAVNSQGERISERCMAQRSGSRSIALWPQSLEPWLPVQLQRSSLLPPYAEGCLPEQASGQGHLRITSLSDGMFIRPRPSSAKKTDYALALQSEGGYGEVSWYLNGVLLGRTMPEEEFIARLSDAGEYLVSGIDQLGQRDEVHVRLQP